MKRIAKLFFGIVLLTAFAVQADLYTAANIEISGVGANPVEAKNSAITAGELQAFNQVIVGLIGANNEAFVEQPEEEEILGMVRDISILEEKNTATSYRGKMNVRFKEKAIQEFLKKNNQAYVKKAPPAYWLIPVWRQGANVWTLEDENPLYQTLKGQSRLSDFAKMILPNGDVDEMVTVAQALDAQEFSDVKSLAFRNGAEQVLVVGVEYSPDGSWKMSPESYTGTENAFYGLSVSGNGIPDLMDGWIRLNNKMAFLWQEKNATKQTDNMTYYARVNVNQMTEWGALEKEFRKMGFLEDLSLQGAMPGQLLLRFNYSKGIVELMDQLDQVGWVWEIDSGALGTLKRKDPDENTL